MSLTDWVVICLLLALYFGGPPRGGLRERRKLVDESCHWRRRRDDDPCPVRHESFTCHLPGHTRAGSVCYPVVEQVHPRGKSAG